MHCTTYIPVYSQLRGCNARENGISWLSSNYVANNGQERENGLFFSSFSMNQHLDSDKEALRRIIQKHEAIFRYQLEELHRLYRRQKELMDENRTRQIFTRVQSLSQTPSDISQTSQNSNWILRNWLDNLSVSTTKVHRPIIAAENLKRSTMTLPSHLLTKNSHSEVEALSSRNEIRDLRVWVLQCPADMEEEKQFEEVNGSKHLAQDLELTPAKIGDFMSFNQEQGNTFFLDLNEPVNPDPASSRYTGSSELCKCHTEICNDAHFSGIDKPMSLMGIDLNSVPLNCLSETVTFEGLVNTNEDFDVKHSIKLLHPLSAKQDHGSIDPFSCQLEMPNASSVDKLFASNTSSVYDVAFSERKDAGEDPVLATNINGEFLKIKSEVDLNTVVIGESLSSTDAPEIDLEAPVSPENKESSPPRGESEDIVIETSPLLSQERKREPEFELDVIAAETLVLISSSEVQNWDFSNCLYWFAEIVSSNGYCYGLENEIEKLHADKKELYIDGIDSFNMKTSKLSRNNVDGLSCKFEKDKEMGIFSGRAVRDKGAKDIHPIKSFHKTGSLKRNGGRNSSAKPKKSKVTFSGVKKSVASIIKEPGTHSKQSVLKGWGMLKKRQSGVRRRSSKFLVIC